MRLAALGATLAFVSASTITPGPASAAYFRSGVNERISVSSSGAQANDSSPNGTQSGESIAMTPDGRFVVFVSTATNLTSDGVKTGTVIDQLAGNLLYVRDRLRHTTVLASPQPTLDSTGKLQYCTNATEPAISDNGRYVVFTSSCQLLTPGHVDPNLNSDIFVNDLKTGTITRVSVANDGTSGNGGSSEPTISGDGHVVVFTSTSTNLTPMPCAGDAYAQAMCTAAKQIAIGQQQVYARNLVTKTTVLVSQSLDGGVANGKSADPMVSPDGRFVEFMSVADDIVANDHNICNPAGYGEPSCPDVFLRDLKTKKSELISVALDGGPGNNESGWMASRRPQAISDDDRYVAFYSQATNLVPDGRTSGTYVRDRRLGRTSRVSVDSTGQPVGGADFNLSRSGRYVTMDAEYGPVTCPPRNPPTDLSSNSPGLVTVHDNVTGGLDVIGWQTADGKPNNCKQYYNVFGGPTSADGRVVAFYTVANNLVKGDTNDKSDAFVRLRGTPLGVGGLAASGSLSVAGSSAFERTGVASAGDMVADVGTAAGALGLDLIGASLAYRPETSDLFVRIQVAQMPLFPLASPFVVYGFDFVAGGTSYELRIGKSGLGATFGLYRHTPSGWTHVRDLAGGYGTTGQEVVAALPLTAIGASDGARLTDVRAFTALAPLGLDGEAVNRTDEISL